MSARESLAVHLYGRHVADVVDAGFGDTALRYTSAAVEDPTGCRLSLSLPLRAETYPAAGPGGRWVRSLLPEGRALAWAVETFGIPEDDRYGLIAALGRDVAGAVQVLVSGEPEAGGHYQDVGEAELADIVGRAHRMGLGLDRARGVRLSLAGMQDKVLLHRVDGEYVVPTGGAPSTVIVKPEPVELARNDGWRFDGIATNEFYCLTLARRCGLDVPDARIDVFGETTSLVIERYDRVERSDGSVDRIHQEDLLGALGLDPLLKYERPHVQRRDPGGGWGDAATTIARPGPTLKDLAGVLSEHLGVANLAPFLRAVSFNVAIGNADAHARNYSVVLPGDGSVAFAPLYDLISTRMWDALDQDAAQRVDGEEDIDEITVDHLMAEGVSWKLPERFVRARIEQIVTAIEEEREPTVSECVARGGDEETATRIAARVGSRVEAMRRPHR